MFSTRSLVLLSIRTAELCPVKLWKRSGPALNMQTLYGIYILISSETQINIDCFFFFFECSVGLNCALGAIAMRPFLQQISKVAHVYVHCYPNAGLPNAMGGYDETAEVTASYVRVCTTHNTHNNAQQQHSHSFLLQEFADDGLINIAGGCCGTTPATIAAITKALVGATPRPLPSKSPYLRLSGLFQNYELFLFKYVKKKLGWEVLTFTPDLNFVNVGERCNVTGSRRFANLIKANKYEVPRVRLIFAFCFNTLFCFF